MVETFGVVAGVGGTVSVVAVADRVVLVVEGVGGGGSRVRWLS